MAELPLPGYPPHKIEMEYNEKFGHTIERIQHIDIMCRIKTCYTTCHLATQTVVSTLTGFQGIKCCAQYMASNPHKNIFYLSNYYDGSNFIRITWSGNKFEDYTTHSCLEQNQYADSARIINRRRLVSGILHPLLDVTV